MVHAVMVTLLPWQRAKYCHDSTIITHTYICTYGNKMCRGFIIYFCTSIDFDVLLHL